MWKKKTRQLLGPPLQEYVRTLLTFARFNRELARNVVTLGSLLQTRATLTAEEAHVVDQIVADTKAAQSRLDTLIADAAAAVPRAEAAGAVAETR